MTIHKKPVEEKEHDSEKYRFMKEQVRPQQKKNAIKYAQKAVSVIVLALIFGSAAGAAFCSKQTWCGHGFWGLPGRNDKTGGNRSG